MHHFIVTVVLATTLVASPSFAAIVIFADGTQMEVSHYEVKGAMFLITSSEGKLLSVPLTYVDMEATERENRGARAPQPQPEQELQPEQEQVPPQPTDAPSPPAQEAPQEPAPPQPTPPVTTSAALLSEPAQSPLVWTNEELEVSLVAPSGDWRIPPMTASIDVAVQLTNPRIQARATLALIRQRMRNYKDFQKVARGIEDSLVTTSSYQYIGAGPLSVEPYTAYEIRFMKDIEGVSFYYRIVVFYSRDLAYALNMSCPQEKLEENEAEFEALIQGLVIKKTRKDITPNGAPRG